MLYKGQFLSPFGSLYILTDEKDLLRTSFSLDGIHNFINSNFKDEKLSTNTPPVLKNTLQHLKLYFQGKEVIFSDIPLSHYGTDFQKSVWTELLKIPYGKTTSYKNIAISLGDKQYARAVGGACGKNHIPIIIPCHRVIRANGEIGGFSPDIEIKRQLLKLEKNSVNKK